MHDQILAALSQYGAPVLFVVTAIASVGIPLPVTLLLIVAGALVAQGVIGLWPALLMAGAGSVIGDQAGYALGRWGGTALISKISRVIGGASRLAQAEAHAKRWGGWAVFLSRWLVSPLGPWVNLTSGISEYPWMRFALWDVLGEILFVVIYVALGRIFNDRVEELDAMLGDFSWGIIALAAAVAAGWKLWAYWRVKGKSLN